MSEQSDGPGPLWYPLGLAATVVAYIGLVSWIYSQTPVTPPIFAVVVVGYVLVITAYTYAAHRIHARGGDPT